jgi:glycosyltransferase involved in cell wall biosynthesis
LLQDMPLPHLFEVTSPDVARHLIGRPSLVPRSTVLHPNSEGVDAVLGDHFPNNRKIVTPLAFFEPDQVEPTSPSFKDNLVIFAHRLTERKNPLVFARAARRFLALRPDWRVHIRGSGPLEPAVREILEVETAAGRVEIGFAPNLVDELQRSRVFVSIESEDNYSNQSVLEAMWCRNAVLLSDRGFTAERYYADNGLLCEPEEDGVLRGLLELTADDRRLDWWGENGHRHVETSFSPDRYIDHLLATYDSVLEIARRQQAGLWATKRG